MNRKKIIVSLVILFAGAIYFIFFFRNKTLKFIPENADVVVVIDVKKLTRQYISSVIMHPSEWFKDKKGDKSNVSLRNSGMKIPDFIQIFHIKNTGFSDWYTVIELDDTEKLSAFLKNRKFISKGENLFQKDRFFIKIEGEKCILGTSDSAFHTISQFLLSPKKKTYNADQLINSTLGSISYLSGEKIRNFSVELNADEIEIKNTSETDIFTSFISTLQQENHFLNAELEAENVKIFTHFFDENLQDSAQIENCKITADLELVNDTIISYGYDDDFNEIEKKSYQKIIQPNYIISLQTLKPEKTWKYFSDKKWINAQNQFTIIPFQPNLITKSKNGIVIKSIRKPILLSQNKKGNYIFVKNSALLSSSLAFLNKAEKKIISNIDYIFYGNKSRDYYVKIKCKKNDLPLILR